MPRKQKQQNTTSTVKQGDIARLFMDSMDVFSAQLMSSLVEKQGDLGISRDGLLEIQKSVNEVKSQVSNSTVDRLLKLY